MKKGVIVASFGTTYEDTRKKTIDVIENEVRDRFPEHIFFRAWTSDVIRRKLERRDCLHIDDIEEALYKAGRQNVEELLVVSTHIMDGVENNKVKAKVFENADRFKKIKIGSALLESERDISDIARKFDKILKKEPDHAYLFMGHGSEHSSNRVYESFRSRLTEYGRDDIYIACVEGYPYIEDVLGYLEKYRRVRLLPFMIVAGEHAKNDMAGDKDSFKTILESAGKKVDFELKGLGEYDFVREMIIEHAVDGAVYER